jgi:hypothetical protein
VALTQEPWTYMGEIKGVGEAGGELIYIGSDQQPSICILVKKCSRKLPLTHHCSRYLTAVKIKTSGGGGQGEIVLGSAYLPCDGVKPLPSDELEKAGGMLQGWRNSPYRRLRCKCSLHLLGKF